jgi:mRNA-degrading endonuclease RelE of RelBE toxin-antitoxin system
MPIQFTERFVKQYERLSENIQRKVDKALRMLGSNFRHPGLRSHPLEGAGDIFEAYVDAKYRLTFERRGNILIMRNVDNHDECLKNP